MMTRKNSKKRICYLSSTPKATFFFTTIQTDTMQQPPLNSRKILKNFEQYLPGLFAWKTFFFKNHWNSFQLTRRKGPSSPTTILYSQHPNLKGGKYLTTQFSSLTHVVNLQQIKSLWIYDFSNDLLFQLIFMRSVDNFTHLPHLEVPTYDKDPFDLWPGDMSNIELLW